MVMIYLITGQSVLSAAELTPKPRLTELSDGEVSMVCYADGKPLLLEHCGTISYQEQRLGYYCSQPRNEFLALSLVDGSRM